MKISELDNLDSLIAAKLLAEKTQSDMADLFDLDIEIEDNVVIKNVCTKVHHRLADRIDEVCARLDISKRKFLEAAFISACNRFDALDQEITKKAES